jgi:predicted porin
VALAWDRERYLQNAIRETNTSLSFRDLGSYKFDEETSLGYDLMYIPTIDEWSRYRIFTAFWLDNKLNKRVTLRLKYSYEKNSFRIPGVNDTDREVTTSLVYSF